MLAPLRIVSLHLRVYFGRGGSQIGDLAGLIASHEPDVGYPYHLPRPANRAALSITN